MSGCFFWFLLVGAVVFVMASLLRWFEQTADAVDSGEWSKLAMLIAVPFSAWFFPSKYSAGRRTQVPHHDPVRGFGKVPLAPSDGPPPGTPKEFIGPPVIPPKKPKAPVDPEKLAKLRQKMKEQGMLDE